MNQGQGRHFPFSAVFFFQSASDALFVLVFVSILTRFDGFFCVFLRLYFKFMNGVVIFSPHRPNTVQNRPMVIQHSHRRIPEVRLYPPESNGPGGGQSSWSTIPSTRTGPSERHSLQSLHLNDSSSSAHFDVLDSEEQLESFDPFHMRPSNLTRFATNLQNTHRSCSRAQTIAIQRFRSGWVSSTAKSLDLVRQNLQRFINKELDEVIRRYVDKFFTPAIENIRRNNGENCVSDEHVNVLCRQILDDAKRMYSVACTRESTPLGDYSDSETGSHSEGKVGVGHRKNPQSRKRKDSDTDSEASLNTLRPFKKKGRPPASHSGGNSGRHTPSKQHKLVEPVRREGPKWDPDRLTKDTLFVMGARANKALGFGQTRGRLYMKHPNVFKYGGDSEDKQWLYDNNLMPATGGKAYMLILSDIRDLAESEEYRNSTGVMLNELVGFAVPDSMLEKMRLFMNSLRTDAPEEKHQLQPPLASVAAENATDETNYSNESLGGIIKPPSGVETSCPPSPVNDLDLLGTESSPAPASSFMIANTRLRDVGSAVDASPASSDLQVFMDAESALSAPIDISECP